MCTLIICALLLIMTADVANGRCMELPQIPDGITIHKVIGTWEEAHLRCKSKGAVLASPINTELLDIMKSLIGINNTPYFTGTRYSVNSGTFKTLEGVLLDDMAANVLEMIQQLDPNDGDCLSMDQHSIRVVPCWMRLPYICYKTEIYNKIEKSTENTKQGILMVTSRTSMNSTEQHTANKNRTVQNKITEINSSENMTDLNDNTEQYMLTIINNTMHDMINIVNDKDLIIITTTNNTGIGTITALNITEQDTLGVKNITRHMNISINSMEEENNTTQNMIKKQNRPDNISVINSRQQDMIVVKNSTGQNNITLLTNNTTQVKTPVTTDSKQNMITGANSVENYTTVTTLKSTEYDTMTVANSKVSNIRIPVNSTGQDIIIDPITVDVSSLDTSTVMAPENRSILNRSKEKCATSDNGYSYYQSTGSCYKIHKDRKSWDEAFEVCRAEDGHLLVIDDENEAKVILRIIYRSGVANPHIGLHYIWGLGWKSVTGKSSEEVYNHWEYGEPKRSSMYTCAILCPLGKLDNLDCRANRQFICEI